jgi:arylsulfatase A-like enzyme
MHGFSRMGALGVALLAAIGCAPDAPPNVILIVMDTTRADHMSVYGYEKDTTPYLRKFGEEAVRFDRAYATSTWTLSSHASLFTGLLPVTHQATQENLRLDDELHTLAELLADVGYETVSFSNNSWISSFTQLAQGFERVDAMWRRGAGESRKDGRHPTNRAVLEWLESRDTKRPYFLFVNYMEPHWPYVAPLAHRERFVPAGTKPEVVKRSGFPAIRWYLQRRPPAPEVLRARVALYDAEIAHLDETLGDLLDGLRSRGDLDASLVILTSDHGENLGEHGHQGHSFTLYDSTLRIPLLIRKPGGKPGGRVRRDPVQLTDVFATVAAAAGIRQLDARVTGVDLLAGFAPEGRAIVAEYYHPHTFLGRFPRTPSARRTLAPFERRIRSIRVGHDKLIWASDGRHELYQTFRDPGETDNLIGRDPQRARALEARLEEIVDGLAREIEQPQPPLSEMDADTLADLRALGYLP